MVNIKDIAKKAGVSISTVSYALNGNTRVSEATRNRIMDIAKEMNYIPNAAGRNLKKQETNIIGAFINDYTAPIYGEILQGMRQYFNKFGYELIICSGEKSHRFIPERMLDGAVILDNSFPTNEILEYADRGHKLVVLDRELQHDNLHTVLLDNKQGASLAINYLIKKGHHKIHIVKGPKHNHDNIQRLHAVRQILTEHLEIDYIEYNGNFTKASGKDVAKQIGRDLKTPAAIFSFNDEMAIGMYEYFNSTGIQIGKDIDIIGFDNIEIANYLQPSLTTIDYSRLEWGKSAAASLLNLINKAPEDKTNKIDLHLIERLSTQVKLI